jgi:hypothetical protein
LMGGQACVFYGAAQFSRDVDLAVLADAQNFDRLRNALNELNADCIAVPPFETRFLEKGHAVHFRCQHPDAAGMRVDIMTRMRGVAPFAALWERRTTLADNAGCAWDLLSLPDLVAAKKTQRDKDWPMIRALVESHYFAQRGTAGAAVDFWLTEARTSELLLELVSLHRDAATRLVSVRPLLATVLSGDAVQIKRELAVEEQHERDADAAYWAPLKAELETLRHQRTREGSNP